MKRIATEELFGNKPRRTWNDAVVRWLKEPPAKTFTKLGWVDQFLGGKPLDAITRASIDRLTDAKLVQGRSNATVSRTLEVLRGILLKCVNEVYRTPNLSASQFVLSIGPYRRCAG
jgi:hypothetical protein